MVQFFKKIDAKYLRFISFPFSRSHYRGRIFIIPVILFAVLYTIPKFFELRVQEIPVDPDLLLTATNASNIAQRVTLVPTDLVSEIVALSLRVDVINKFQHGVLTMKYCNPIGSK